MNTALPWPVALHIAWREMRAARAKFLFVILAVAVGIGALTGVRGFSRSFRRTLLSQARTLMAADLSARIFALPTPQQEAALGRLEQRGVRRTWITETVTMASSAATANPLLISVKAVDPSAYPFYGVVRLSPPAALADALKADTVVVSDDLLIRLGVRVGDSIRIGGKDFRIAGVVVSEPDRMTGSLNVGPRVMITREGLDRTGLIGVGSRASERFLFKLPAGGTPSVAQVRTRLKRAFPEATIADFTETHPTITRGLNRATTFLSLIGLIALVIGSMGVASTMHGHLQQKLDSIAVMKCIGGRSGQVMRIYVAQTLMLGLAGGLLGVALGVGVSATFPSLIARYFTLDSTPALDAWPALQGVAIACLVTLLFTVPPLLGIRKIRPAEIFRRDMQPETVARHRRWKSREMRAQLLALAAILAGTGGVAATLTESGPRDAMRAGAYFALALAAGVALLAMAAWLLLRATRVFLRHFHSGLPSAVRQGLANLDRPGSQVQTAVVALGVGVMFTLSVFLVQHALIAQLRESTPPGMPNVFLLDIPEAQREAVAALVKSQPGVQSAPDVTSAVAAHLVAINGTPIGQRLLHDWTQRYMRTRVVTAMAAKPPETEILDGAWWKAGDRQPMVCLSEEAAKILKVSPGDLLDWNIWDRTIHTRVACIQRTESVRLAARFEFIFNPGPLDGLPAVYYGSARVAPANVPELQRVVYERYPTVTVVNVADVMQIVEQVVDRIAILIRFISAFTILAGAMMVAAAVADTRFRRIREVVILKTLGATRRRIAGIFSVEYLALGAVAGLMGSVLAWGFAALLLGRLLDLRFHFEIWPALATVVLAALLAAAAGWAASFRILGRKPLEILRGE
ncbi:MAG TPA: FtsX-like permease family protein [Bryobacteraceae bacterium]|nr:FtsX-like permease family protein [Bryobacteraceae bacterium]